MDIYKMILTKSINDFKSRIPFEKRKEEATRIIAKYPDKIPVIVQKKGLSSIPAIDKSKYLVPMDITIGQFLHVIRKRIKITPDQAIFIFVNDTLPASSTIMSNIYKNNKDKDGFLYLSYTGESTFG